MLLIIAGSILLVAGSVSYWRLLPTGGQVHPLVEKYDGGAMLTIVLMTVITIGVALVFDGLVD